MGARLDTGDVRQLANALRSGALAPALDDADRIDRVRLFEELKSIAAAIQADEAVGFDRSQRAAQAIAHEPRGRQGRGVASQLALARRISPWAAQRWLGFAKVMTAELPATLAELRAGRTTEWRALMVARETAVLSREHRASVDVEVARQIERWGDRQVDAETRRAAYRLDPHASVARARRADSERGVSIRPVPDTMCRVSALLPLVDGVAAYAALSRAADLRVGVGDEPRGRAQVMADAFVARLTRADADSRTPPVAVEIQLIMTDQTLLDAGSVRDEPATVVAPGVGALPVPASLARDLALNANGSPRDGLRWIRRLYRAPGSGQLVAMESRRRLFTTGQQRFLRTRDLTCRTPWCDAPIRHADHVLSAAKGGATSVANGAGLCEACNQAKEALDWNSQVDGGAVVTLTPTGHRYLGHPPDPPRATKIELYFAAQLRKIAA